MSKPTLAELITRRVEANAKKPHDFGATLDAMRVIREALIHSPTADFWTTSDAMEIIESYLYERATPDEMKRRADRGRDAANRLWEALG